MSLLSPMHSLNGSLGRAWGDSRVGETEGGLVQIQALPRGLPHPIRYPMLCLLPLGFPKSPMDLPHTPPHQHSLTYLLMSSGSQRREGCSLTGLCGKIKKKSNHFCFCCNPFLSLQHKLLQFLLSYAAASFILVVLRRNCTYFGSLQTFHPQPA